MALGFYQLDQTLHRHIRTTNHLERLFREFRTKSDEIGAFPHNLLAIGMHWGCSTAIAAFF